ncbi:MAG TPA: hypothetical protein VMU05_01050 [Dongiaceae bacterium]|nr:hypothetical protein [Dongiaceae bacterium]
MGKYLNPIGKGTIQGLCEGADGQAATANCEHRVVVRLNDGTTVKGVMHWHDSSPNPTSMPFLPDILTVRDESGDVIATVNLAEVKAVFFVRSYAGDSSYQEMQFFRERKPSSLWVQVWMSDGEALEGRVENCFRLLTAPGFWLWPTDGIANNLLVYIPKDSISEFHVTGVGATRSGQITADLTGRNARIR